MSALPEQDELRQAAHTAALLDAAARLAKELLDVGAEKNVFERVVLGALQDPDSRWQTRVMDLLKALKTGSLITRSKTLADGIVRMPAALLPLLQDRRWTDADKRRILGYVRWELLIQKKLGPEASPVAHAPAAPAGPSVREVQEQERARIAALDPAERLRELTKEESQRETHQRRDWLLSLVGKAEPIASFGADLGTLKAALATVFAADVSAMREVVAGNGPDQRLLGERQKVCDAAKPGSKARKEAEAAVEKAEKAAAKERQRVDRYRPFLAWLDARS
jgi:hypothetical protein